MNYTRHMRIAIVLLLYIAATLGDVRAQSIVLVDLSQEEVCSPAVLDTVRKDLIVAGFRLMSESSEQGVLLQTIEREDDSKYLGTLEAATRAYEKFDLAQALVLLGQSDSVWKSQPRAIRSESLSQRYLLQGLVHLAQGKRKDALADFRLSHNLQQSREQLPADQYRPAVVALYAQAKRANNESEIISITKDWTPLRSRLSIDGKLVHSDKMRSGVHLVKLEAPGYRSYHGMQSISSGTRLSYPLEALASDEQLIELRKSLVGQASVKKEILSEIAKRSSTDSLVLVKRKSGVHLASVYRVSDNTLTSWAKPGSLQWQNALGSHTRDVPLVPIVSQSGSSQKWYKSWWGGGLIATGSSAVIGTALYFLLSPSNSSAKGATIDQWCFGDCP